jgi:hypothetical protein
MRFFLNIVFITLLNLIAWSAKAQSAADNQVEMADVLHQNGKIYLVVLVLVTIFAGVLWMLIRIERKLAKLENSKN